MHRKNSGYEKNTTKDEDNQLYKAYMPSTTQQDPHYNTVTPNYTSTFPSFINNESKSAHDAENDLKSSHEQLTPPLPPTMYDPRMYPYPPGMDMYQSHRTVSLNSVDQRQQSELHHPQGMDYPYRYGSHSGYTSLMSQRSDLNQPMPDLIGEVNEPSPNTGTSEATEQIQSLSIYNNPSAASVNLHKNERLNSSFSSHSSSISSSGNNTPATRKPRQVRKIPEELKDEAYREKRRKNNESAKRSRELKRHKDEKLEHWCRFMDQTNLGIMAEIKVLKDRMKNCPTCSIKL